MQQQDDDTLRVTIRRKLADGTLPVNGIARIWGGPPDGETCHACDEPILGPELLMEAIASRRRPMQLHVRCFYLWDSERTPGLDPGQQ